LLSKGIFANKLQAGACLALYDPRKVRNLQAAPRCREYVGVKIGGYRTRSVFSRYNIVDSDDLLDAMSRVTARLQK
jgi:hypothetical protein